MATSLSSDRENRTSDIVGFYKAYTDFVKYEAEDGSDTDTSLPQAKFKAFNDLINILLGELNLIIGYASSPSAFLPSDEGTVNTGLWWENADPSNNRAEFFFTDSTYANNINILYEINYQSAPNQRSPYFYGNQYYASIGTPDHLAWRNASDISGYTDTKNPFQTGSNYLLGAPLEYYGNIANLLWRIIIYNGEWVYRNKIWNNSSFNTFANVGFVNLEYAYAGQGLVIPPTLDRPLGNLFYSQSSSNYWPSPFEIFRYTYWGDASNTTSASTIMIQNYSTNSFTLTSADTTVMPVGGWYAIYDPTVSTNGWLVHITNVATTTISSTVYAEYTFDYSLPSTISPPPNIYYNVITSPIIPDSIKTGTTSNGLTNIWSAVYNTYYTSFQTYANGISVNVSNWISYFSNNIYNFDYTIINQEMGSTNIVSQTQGLATNLTNWLTNWKSLIGDTGSGPTFSVIDSKWSDSSLDSLITNASGGINLIIRFGTGSGLYTDTQSGYINTRKSYLYSILGDYSLGSSETWLPSTDQAQYNNTGSFTGSTSLYAYRFRYADQRIDKNGSTLKSALSAYNLYNNDLSDVPIQENDMSTNFNVTGNEYDTAPTNVTATNTNSDNITISWDSVKGASSYDISRKEGLNGTWSIISSNYGYVDPGPTYDFSKLNPPASYADSAYTVGSQTINLSIANDTESTNLSNDFTYYDFNLAIDGGSTNNISVKGMDCQTWSALVTTINNYLSSKNLNGSVAVVGTNLVLSSATPGVGSSILITTGTNDLITALGGTLSTSVAGTTLLDFGKVYYYRVRVNNGYNVSLGATANSYSGDWNSVSEWHNLSYTQVNGTTDKYTNGEGGSITWSGPTNVIASGVSTTNGLTGSYSGTTIQWDSSYNASSYNIFRATSVNGGYSLIGTSTTNSYIDSTGFTGFTYYYKVQAVSASDSLLFDTTSNLYDIPLITPESSPAAAGKTLWAAPTATATTTDSSSVTVNWTAVSGADSYIIYKSNVETGTYSPISNDDATTKLITGTSYVDAEPAYQYATSTYSTNTSTINVTPNHLYYFIVIATQLGNSTVKQYSVNSPNSSTWSIADVTTAINNSISAGNNDVIAEVVYLANPSPVYKIKFYTSNGDPQASISILDGTFGDSLLTLLGGMDTPQSGTGAFSGINYYYKVQGVQTVNGEVVRSTELTNVLLGFRPVFQ